jgi:hypothetical protein
MFVYSGFDKIMNFRNKVNVLQKKLPFFSKNILDIGMALVIILEIFGPLIILFRIVAEKNCSEFLKVLSNITLVLFLIFLILVTLLYHPPRLGIIPFLSNCTTFAGLLLLLTILNPEFFESFK